MAGNNYDEGYEAYGERQGEPGQPEGSDAVQAGENKPRILLMGLKKSGKSSIQKVVFHKMSPNETLFLESTSKLVKSDISNNSFVQFHIWDFPGQLNVFDSTFDAESIFGGCGALIFVIDAQDAFDEALESLKVTLKNASKINRHINFEVFVHKADGLSDDNKLQAMNRIRNKALDDSKALEADGIRISFHTTSIYDHSIFEAFSKVIQKLVPQLPTLENLLDNLVSSCRIEKAFLIDVVSKIYIATDSAPVDMQTYELCSDMIDIVIDVSCIYGMKDGDQGLAYDVNSHSVIRLKNDTVLYLHEVNKYLALVAVIRGRNFSKHGLIEYNVGCFRNAIGQIFNIASKE
eukprot:CAMPEP_0119120028 /NCGR_PEP_ID=MMETSP1310-20130426/1257_1 /TAXON_ID=464262 /ORGANISM="Genus nov. species nov., Strain RCC2339" /LENGTH=347 /DNA_ID=CAMNT_0007109491 /DNA_START=232 /DNA_END=1275 /DNA_ORIENTATION=+